MACSPDGREETTVSYDPAGGLLTVGRDRSDSADENESYAVTADHKLRHGEHLELRILLDGSALEIIANHRTSLSARIYPVRTDSRGVRIFGNGVLREMSFWQMRPAN